MSNACMTCLVTLLVGKFAKQIVEATTNGQGQQFDTKFVTYFACMRIYLSSIISILLFDGFCYTKKYTSKLGIYF